MKLGFLSILSNISRSARGRVEQFSYGLAGFLLLSGCSHVTSTYEHADFIDKQVHRGAEVLDFNAVSSRLVSGGWGGELALWSLPQGSPTMIWQGHEGPVHGLGFADPWVVSAGQDGWLKVWDDSGELHYQHDTGVAVERAAVSEKWVVSGHQDGSVRIWTLPRLELVRELRLHQSDVRAVAVQSGANRFASIGRDRQLFVWDADAKPRHFVSPPGMVRSLEFSPDGSTLWGGGWENLFKWDTDDGQLKVLPTDHWGLISSIDYVPTLDVLATISRINDSSVYFLDPNTGMTERTFTPQQLCGGAIAMSPDGRYLATTGDDGAVRMWDLSIGASVQPVTVVSGSPTD